jgi:hypothetical protein
MAGYDPTAPGDASQISVFPSNERGQRLNTETLHDLEHDPTTGIHQVRVGSDAQRNAITWPNNASAVSLWGKIDYADLEVELQYLQPGEDDVWHGIHDEFMQRQNGWLAGQNGEWLVDPSPSATIVMDFDLGNFFYVAIEEDVTINNPNIAGRPAALPAGCYFLELEQGTAGDHDITAWGSAFVFGAGLAPADLTDGVGSIDLIQMIVRQDGKIHAEIVRDSQ